MTIFKVKTAGQMLAFDSASVTASGSVNTVKLQVTLDAPWAGFAVSAVFFTKNKPTVYEVILAEGECIVPHEVLTDADILFIGLRGVNAADNTVLPSTLVQYRIQTGAPVGDGTTEEPTPDVYQQLLTAYGDATVLPADLAAVICPGVTNPTVKDALTALLPRNGKAAMTGPLVMAGNPVSGLPDPTEGDHAATKSYVDACEKKKLSLDGTTAMTGNLDMDGHKVTGLGAPEADGDAVNLGTLNASVKKAAPHNLLDNSDFTNPVNQRGQTIYEGNIYTIDRWSLWMDDTTLGTLTLTDDGVAATKHFYQNLDIERNKMYTAAVMTENGLYVVSGNPSDGTIVNGCLTLMIGTGGYVQVDICNGGKLYWAALYEGEYTAETLPEYQPKGYAAELLECQRYFYDSRCHGEDNYVKGSKVSYVRHSTFIVGDFLFPVDMRITPTVTIYSMMGTINTVSNWSDAVDMHSGKCAAYSATLNRKGFTGVSLGESPADCKYAFHYTASADL